MRFPYLGGANTNFQVCVFSSRYLINMVIRNAHLHCNIELRMDSSAPFKKKKKVDLSVPLCLAEDAAELQYSDRWGQGCSTSDIMQSEHPKEDSHACKPTWTHRLGPMGHHKLHQLLLSLLQSISVLMHCHPSSLFWPKGSFAALSSLSRNKVYCGVVSQLCNM